MNASIVRRAVHVVAITAATVGLTTAMSAAQDALVAVRDLYRAAAYEDALIRLDGLKGSAHVAEEGAAIEQYRAFCLLALGRTAEAERAIEAVVTAAPSFRPSEDQSPRVPAVFRDVRRQVLPVIIQQLYAQAKAAFDRHDAVSANAGFQQVLDLLADADLATVVDQPPLAALRPLAIGFRDLSARATPAPPPAAPPPAAVPSVSHEPPAKPPPKRIYSAGDVNVVPPVVVHESWAALGGVFAVRTGVVEIVIDETGAVAAATMTAAVNVVYDRLALTTAKRWRYRPATLDGVPVKFRKVILLDLKATRND